MVCVRLLFTKFVVRTYSLLKFVFGLSQIMEQSSEVAMTARAKPSGKVFSASRNAREMGGQRLPWVSEKWS